MFAVTVQECELCKTRPARDGGRLCEECMGISSDDPRTELKECKVCHQLYWVDRRVISASEIDKARKGWCSSCTSKDMLRHKQKPQTKPEQRKPAPQPEEPLQMIKTCTDCGERFAPYKHGSSNPNICLACMRRHSSDGMRGKWLKQFRNEGMLILDSEMLQELLPKIEQDAAMCLRTVEAQCLWYILERARKL